MTAADNPAIDKLVSGSVKRSRAMFADTPPLPGTGGALMSLGLMDFEPVTKARVTAKIAAEYSYNDDKILAPSHPNENFESSNASLTNGADTETLSSTSELIDKVKRSNLEKGLSEQAVGASDSAKSGGLVVYNPSVGRVGSGKQEGSETTALVVNRRKMTSAPTPEWHAPWKLQSVVSGHLGWVRCLSFDPGNEWFVTGAGDRTIKVWDLAKCSTGAEGGLKLTLTGHIHTVRGLAVSKRHPYMFSAGEDKKRNVSSGVLGSFDMGVAAAFSTNLSDPQVMCWDLEHNKVIRHYHGHLSAVFCLKLHPTLDVLITGGRDSAARIWDIRTKQQVHCLTGHTNAVASVITNSTDPQVITGSHDCQIKLWDLAAGKCMTTLTNHKKAVRALVPSRKEFSFVSAGADNMKKWQTRNGVFLHNLRGHSSIVNALAGNEDNVLFSGGDNGSITFWDYDTGCAFQTADIVVQPGSLDAEAGIFAAEFDMSGSRLVTCEADKTVKIWSEDSSATPESHPIDMSAWKKEYNSRRRA